jgi:flagellar hook-length control protein FliK
MFAQEVERAVERTRGDGLHAKRIDEQLGARRTARRAGFGGAHAPEPAHESSEPSATPPAPVAAQAAPAPATRAPDELALPEPAEPAPVSASPAATTKETAAESHEPVAAARTPAPAVAPQPNPGATRTEGRATPAARTEPAPLEPPPIVRLGSERSAKPTSGARAAGSPEAAIFARAEEILRQIRLHATPGVQRLTLDLEPADLGRLSIQLALRAGRVTAIVRAESAQTLESLKQREHDLRAVLDERGVRADTVRFELGFGGAFARHEPPTRTPFSAAPRDSAPAPVPPPGSAARIDTYA